MRRGSFKRRLPRGRHSRKSYLAPALLGISILSVLLASAFFLHLLPGLSGPSTSSTPTAQKDQGMLKVASADDGLIATVMFSQEEAMTRVQIENTGSDNFKRVKVMADGGRILGILSQLEPDEKKVITARGNLSDVEITAIGPLDRGVFGEVRYEKPKKISTSFSFPGGSFSGGSVSSSSSSPQGEAQLSTQAVKEQPVATESPKAAESPGAVESNPISQGPAPAPKLDDTPRFNITITTNRSSGCVGDVVGYVCSAVNCGKETLSDVKLFCSGETTSTTYLTPGKEIRLEGAFAINDSVNIGAGVQGTDTAGRLWTNNASARIWRTSPQLSLMVTATDKVHRGQSIDLTAEVTNSGEGSLTNLLISDAFGEMGRISLLQPGESRSLHRNLSIEESMVDLVEAKGSDAAGRDVYASKEADLKVFTTGLDISSDKSEFTSYPGFPVDVTWTLKNTGEETLKNVTLSCEGTRCRLREIPPGGCARMEAVYIKDCTSRINVTVEGRDQAGCTVGSTGSILIRTISPGISLKVMPPEIEASKGENVNLSCLVTNSGDDFLKDIEISLDGDVLASIDQLAPGEFKVMAYRMVINSNTTFNFTAEGRDSRGRIWSDSMPVEASITTSALRASVSATKSGENAAITCTVTNSGSYALYNIFVISKAFGPLGTIDYLPPKGQRSVRVERQVKSEVDDQVSIEAFTFEKQPVHASCRLHIAGPKPHSDYKETQPASTRRVLSVPGLNQEISGPQAHPSTPDLPQRSSIKSALNHTATDSGKEVLSGIEGLMRYIQRMLGQAGAEAHRNYNSSNDISGETTSEITSAPDIPEGTNASRDYELSIASVRGSEHGAIRILDVSASPSQPAAGQSVKFSVHAKSASAIKSAKAQWGLSDAPLTKQYMMDVDRIHSMPMTLESGDSRDGYWSCVIPGRVAGTYMVISAVLRDGDSSAEDGPYMLHWSTVNSEKTPGAASVASQRSGNGMLFIESSVVNGKGEVSIKDNIDDSAVHYNEKMKANGSINLETMRCIDKSAPGINFSQKKDLVFTGGQLKGTKLLESPTFEGGMGASITERYNLSHVDKSDTDTIKSANYTYNSLAFNTDQAFEGSWNIQTRYAQFYKKMKADQQYTGSFQTQKKIKFEDN